MEKITSFAPLVARLLLAATFILAGIFKLGAMAGFAGYVASGGLPAILAWPAILFEITLGFAMLLGFQTWLAGLAGAAFCVVTAVLYHSDLADQVQAALFFKNLAIAGGFLMFVAHGAGAPSLDARRA